MDKLNPVTRLQMLATDEEKSVVELLRFALIVATKLKIADFKTWIERELNGYAGLLVSDIPKYRFVRGEVKAFNPYRGYIPVTFQSREQADRESACAITNPIAELVDACNGAPDKHVVMDLSPEQDYYFMQEHGMKARRFLSNNHFTGIVSTVRNAVLTWALKLEEEGITGDGMSFSESEKQKAATTSSVHIQNFHGVMGNVTGENVQIGDYGSIHQKLKDAGVSQAERNEIEDVLDKLKIAKPEEKAGLVQRGMDWIARNGEAIGAVAKTVTECIKAHAA